MTTTLDLHARGTIDDLVGRLETHDVTVPGINKWRELKIDLTVRPAPARPMNMLERTADELDAWARELAAYRLAAAKPNHYGTALGDIGPLLDQELKRRIKDNAASIIDQLRPDFDQAADAMREAVRLGIEPKATIESLFKASMEVREAWLATHAHAATLDSILTTRQLLSTVAGVKPELGLGRQAFTDGRSPSGIDWSTTVVTPGSGVSLAEHNYDAPWERWIRIAPHLHLVTPN